MSKVCLVTGGSGYFGQVLSSKLIKNNYKVIIIDLHKTNLKHNNLKYIRCDITNKIEIEEVFSKNKIEIVFHNAAVLPIENSKKRFWDVNFKGTINMIEMSIKYNVRKFSYMSSASIFADCKDKLINEKTIPLPVEEYGKSKLAGEAALLKYKNEIDIDIIRPRTVVGRGRYGLFQIVFEWIYKGYKIPLLNKGNNIFQFIHCDDLADFSILIESLKGYNIFNVGTNGICKIYELVDNLIKHASSKSKIIKIPKFFSNALKIVSTLRLTPVNKWHISALTKDQYYDNFKISKELNWIPKYNNIEMICESYDQYLIHRINLLKTKKGSVHQRKLKKGLLNILEFILKL